MIIIDENYNIITNPDLKKGYLMPCTIIDPDATPVDNINKFAWYDEDYIEAQMYVLNKPKPEPIPDRYQEQIDELTLALADMYGGNTQ